MPDPTEAPGSNYESPGSVSHEQPSEDRGLADKLLSLT
jgi:hypothetical protein